MPDEKVERVPPKPLVVVMLTIPEEVDISIVINGEQFLVQEVDD